MFKFIKKKVNIEYFLLKYKIEVIRFKDNSLSLNGALQDNLKIIGFGENGFVFKKYADNDTYLSNIFTKFEKKLDSNLSYSIGHIVTENGTIFDINSTFDEAIIEFRKDYYYHNFITDEKKLLLKQAVGYFTINYENSTKSIFRSNNILKSLSLLTGNYEWEIDLANLQLSESVTLKSIIGVWHNELLLWLNDALLVSLDINSGTLLWSYDLDESVKAFGAVLMSPFYDEKEDSDTIHCFGASGYLTFDLVSRKATFHKSFGRVGTGMSPHLSTKSGDYFYFVGRDYSIKDGLGVGIFNCKTFNIDWFYTSPEWKDGSNSFIVFSSAPQVTDNELYVLENGSGTLHIFERTETAAI